MVYESVVNTRVTLNGMGFQTIALTFDYLGVEWEGKPISGYTWLERINGSSIDSCNYRKMAAGQTVEKSRERFKKTFPAFVANRQ